MAIYRNATRTLQALLADATSGTGATLLIPELQRSFVWQPSQVIRLIDSLIKGWPIGTLLLWNVKRTVSDNETASIPCRAFFTQINRSDDETAPSLPAQEPPAEYLMVLDGQQRIQSLVVAFSVDEAGFKLNDRDWAKDLETSSAKSRSTKHWSLGSLCIDINALVKSYEDAQGKITAIDYSTVLQWVITDTNQGLSRTRRPPSYINPLSKLSEGAYVRLSRLWAAASGEEGVSEAMHREACKAVLRQYEISDDLITKSLEPFGVLLSMFSQIKRVEIAYLELTPFKPQIQSDAEYNDAIVNIFTRLNAGGQALTKEEITFAWLKTTWLPDLTNGKGAVECVDELVDILKETSLNLSAEQIVQGLSVMWAIYYNEGRLLSEGDLLKGSIIRKMAQDLSQQWTLISDSFEGFAAQLESRGLRYRDHYLSLNAFYLLWSVKFIAEKWISESRTGVVHKEVAVRTVMSFVGSVADRWFLCSNWSGAWAGGAKKTLPDFAKQLHAVLTSSGQSDFNSVMASLRDIVDKWLNSFVKEAAEEVYSLSAGRREDVGKYYPFLWVWHRLDKERWKASDITLLDPTSKKDPKTEVDHLISVSKVESWKNEIKEKSQVIDDEAASYFHSLGNCSLLKKNFNISKGAKTLKEFISTIPEISKDWYRNLAIPEKISSSDFSNFDALIKEIKDRDNEMKTDLIGFVHGTKVRVDY